MFWSLVYFIPIFWIDNRNLLKREVNFYDVGLGNSLISTLQEIDVSINLLKSVSEDECEVGNAAGVIVIFPMESLPVA